MDSLLSQVKSDSRDALLFFLQKKKQKTKQNKTTQPLCKTTIKNLTKIVLTTRKKKPLRSINKNESWTWKEKKMTIIVQQYYVAKENSAILQTCLF